MTLIEKLQEIFNRNIGRSFNSSLTEKELSASIEFQRLRIFSSYDFNKDYTEISSYELYALSQYFYDYMLNGYEGHYKELYDDYKNTNEL